MSTEPTVTPVDRADPIVRELYEVFIREADGPLGIDLEAEFADGPPRDLVPPNGILLIARIGDEPVGLGGVRDLDAEAAEIKSMFVAGSKRGLGIGRRLLEALETIAAARGCRAVRLDTSDYLAPAVGLYRSAGYTEVADYNGNSKANLWFERPL